MKFEQIFTGDRVDEWANTPLTKPAFRLILDSDENEQAAKWPGLAKFDSAEFLSAV